MVSWHVWRERERSESWHVSRERERSESWHVWREREGEYLGLCGANEREHLGLCGMGRGQRVSRRGQSPDACVLRIRAANQGWRFIHRYTTLACEESMLKGSECRGGEYARMEPRRWTKQRDRRP